VSGLTMERGELVTVLPHRPKNAEWVCGRWHGRIRYEGVTRTGWWWVQEIKEVDGAWEVGMTALVHRDYLVPIEVQVPDLP
jgi:hypothetical protein